MKTAITLTADRLEQSRRAALHLRLATIAFAGLITALVILGAPYALGNPLKVTFDETEIDRTASAPLSYAPMISEAQKSVVHIFTTTRVAAYRGIVVDPAIRRFFNIPESGQQGEITGLGSGVIITEDGYIMTNNHLVEDVDEIKVKMPSSANQDELDAVVVGTDPRTDVALLKVEASGLPAIKFSKSDQLQVGDQVFAIGNPLDVGQTVTSGIVSALGRSDLGIVDFENFIQTDAAINQGNSGGPLIDVKGRIVGLNTAIISRSGGSQGIGLAVPVNLAYNVVRELATDGTVERGFLGVEIRPVTDELAEMYGMRSVRGVMIANVIADSPADKAGLRAGDIVTEVNGTVINRPQHLQSVVGQLPPGTEVRLKANRRGETKDFMLILADSETYAQVQRTARSLPDDTVTETPEVEEDFPLSGVQMSDFDAGSQSSATTSYPEGLKGAIITGLASDSEAARAGLEIGDIILQIDGEAVTGAEEAATKAREAKGGKLLVRIWRQGRFDYKVIG